MRRSRKFDLTNIFQIIYFIKPLKGVILCPQSIKPARPGYQQAGEERRLKKGVIGQLKDQG
jgi:hypothetical protein